MNNKEILCDTLMKYSKENISKGVFKISTSSYFYILSNATL